MKIFENAAEKAEARLGLAAVLLIADVSARGLSRDTAGHGAHVDRAQRIDSALLLADDMIARAEALQAKP